MSRDVEPRAAAALVAEGALAVDVREAAELQEDGYLEGSRHVPLGELSARAGELPADRPLVLICQSGTRSAMAAAALRASGYEAYSVAGGMLAWRRDGLPVARLNP